jgi:hypothetical protein
MASIDFSDFMDARYLPQRPINTNLPAAIARSARITPKPEMVRLRSAACKDLSHPISPIPIDFSRAFDYI